MHDTVKLRRMGIPSAAVALDVFEGASRLQARSMGMEDTPIVVIPRNKPEEWVPETAAARAELAFEGLVKSLEAQAEKAGMP